jgi:hypothetical protein
MPKNVPGQPDHAALEESPVFRKLNYSEPAVLRGIITAAIMLAASLGFVATDEIKGAAEGLIPIVAFLLPLIQSLWTRQAVVSPQTHAEKLGAAEARLAHGPR